MGQIKSFLYPVRLLVLPQSDDLEKTDDEKGKMDKNNKGALVVHRIATVSRAGLVVRWQTNGPEMER